MQWIYRRVVRPLLFEQDPESAHHRALTALSWASQNRIWVEALASLFESPVLPVRMFGLDFPNPVGLAAGMDKYATALPVWEGLGFGFAELGGVTWLPQEGNPSPRLFRAVESEGLINRMGLNNPGAEAFAARLAGWRARGRWPDHPVGINLGKSKDTPLAQAPGDYSQSFEALWVHGDFFVINVSSPNTPNLRDLQLPEALDEVIAAVQESNARLASTNPAPVEKQKSRSGKAAEDAIRGKPILVKISPDLSLEALDDLLRIASARNIAGIVAANTTIARPETEIAGLARVYAETGGLSGRPVTARSTELIRHIHRQSGGKMPVIGVGGVFSSADAWEKITAGASLLQVYTGLVYEGPGVACQIVRGLRDRLNEHGMKQLSEAVGIHATPTGV